MTQMVRIAFLLAGTLAAQPLRSLKAVPVPATPGIENYVRDNAALTQLGKAFFWDMQAGSDGRTACASCHFHAGADHRRTNQLAGSATRNTVLTADLFPFRKLADPSNRNSTVLADATITAGSAGLPRRAFQSVLPGQPAELGHELDDQPEATLAGLQLRRVTSRNSPSVINAAYYQRGFWDGRAARVFNGLSPSGEAPGALVLRNGELVRESVSLNNAALASQATGPILDHLEMSYAGRTWAQLAQKLLSVQPLALQRVAPDDSLLGPLAHPEGRGLATNYLALIQQAFHPQYWERAEQQTENFPLFWALALQAYQNTLVSNDSPFDRFQDGETAALTAQEQEGMRLFQTTGRCATCHGGAEFSAAAVNNANIGRGGGRAFQRTGVRPAAEDPGSGNGNFKSIGLRNVELTGPYFHNGSQATLEQVIDFYARGGDFANNDIRPFNMSTTQKAALAAFLRALTDDRVRYERAPFDHPELCLPDGHVEQSPGVPAPAFDPLFPLAARDNWVAIPAVGANGSGTPLRTFEELLQGLSNHSACTAPLR
jgi:cytochrome c peroxidase